MKAQTRSRMVDMLKGAASMLVLVPDVPGIADNAAVGGLRLIISAVTRALENGLSITEIVTELEDMAPAERLDVDEEVEKFAGEV